MKQCKDSHEVFIILYVIVGISAFEVRDYYIKLSVVCWSCYGDEEERR